MAIPALLVELVWQGAHIVDAQNEAMGFRKDQCREWIQRNQYGSRTSPYGWEIDHIVPRNNGGSDHISNLRPFIGKTMSPVATTVVLRRHIEWRGQRAIPVDIIL